MNKALLISNLAIKFTNFIVPPIEVLQQLGYEIHTCANYSNFNDNQSKYDITMHHIDFERNPFNLKNIKAYKQLLKLMQEENFDLVHCNTPIGGLLGRICAKKAKVSTVIYTAHGFHFYKGAPLINNVLYKNVEKSLAKYTDVLITMNKEDYEAAQKFKLRKNGKVKLIHGVGIDTTNYGKENFATEEYREKLGLKNDDIVMIALGELNKNKNYSTMINAIKLANNSKVHLLICGAGEEKYNLEKLARENNLDKNVHFLGYRNDVPKLLASSDIFIQTSHREGLPRAIMEAMASGLPCIVSKIRGNVDLIDENGGILCDSKDIRLFSEAIDRLATDKKLRVKMGEHNIEVVRPYDVDNIKKEMKNIYEEVLR